MLLFVTLVWLVFGFAVARYFLQQHTWFTLLPMSLGLGLTLQTLMLNLLLYPLDALTGYWVSVVLSGTIALILFVWQRKDVQPISLGASPLVFGLTFGAVLFIWVWTLPALFRFEYYDQEWHYPLAGTIAAGGLPVRMSLNPDYCPFYHYAPDLLAGTIFRVANTRMSTTYDWTNAAWVLAFLGLAVNVVRSISQRRSLFVGWLGMALFFFYGHAAWMELPFYNETVREWTADMPAFKYFHERAEDIRPTVLNGGFTFTQAAFVHTNVGFLHTHSINVGLTCIMLILLLMLDKKPGTPGTASHWITVGLILGLLPLAFETLWPVPLAAIGFYGLYLLFTEKEHWRRLTAHGMLIFVPAIALGIFQGGAITDALFCQEDGLGLTSEGEPLTTVSFPSGPGYYTWHIREDNDYVALDEVKNWPRALDEFGIVVLLYPFILYHYVVRRRHPFATAFTVAAILPVLGILITDFEVIRVNSTRLGSVPLTLLALMAADWLDWEWQQGRKLLVIGLVAGMCFTGVFSLFGKAVHSPDPGNEEDRKYGNAALFAELDEKVQEKWFGKVGEREQIILDMYSSPITYIRPSVLLGHYTLFLESRSDWTILPYIAALREFPDPDFLRAFNIEYIYLDEVWWRNAYPQAIALIENPAYFEEIFTETDGEAFRKLYRVVESESDHQPINLDEARLIPAQYFLAIFNWPEIVPPGAAIFHPGFSLAPYLKDHLPGLKIQSDLDVPAQSAIDRWRETKLPDGLREAGFEYLYLDSIWFTFASDADVKTIDENYTLAFEMKLNSNGAFFRVYHVPAATGQNVNLPAKYAASHLAK